MAQFTISGYDHEANLRFKKIRFTFEEAMDVLKSNVQHYKSMYICTFNAKRATRTILHKETNDNYTPTDATFGKLPVFIN